MGVYIGASRNGDGLQLRGCIDINGMNQNGDGFWPWGCSNVLVASLFVHHVVMATHSESDWSSVDVQVSH